RGALDRGVGQGEGTGELVGVASYDRQVGGDALSPGVEDGRKGGGGRLVVDQQAGDVRVGVEQPVHGPADLGLPYLPEGRVQPHTVKVGLFQGGVLEPPDIGTSPGHDVFGL